MTKSRRWRAIAACGLFALGLGACSGPSNAAPAQTLSGVTVPDGSTLAMSRAVSVSISASAAAVPAGTVGKVEVRRPDGAVLFTGPMIASQGLASKVALPTNQSSLTVVLRVPGKADVSLAAAVSSNAATASF